MDKLSLGFYKLFCFIFVHIFVCSGVLISPLDTFKYLFPNGQTLFKRGWKDVQMSQWIEREMEK